jgi:hypothetical protein
VTSVLASPLGSSVLHGAEYVLASQAVKGEVWTVAVSALQVDHVVPHAERLLCQPGKKPCTKWPLSRTPLFVQNLHVLLLQSLLGLANTIKLAPTGVLACAAVQAHLDDYRVLRCSQVVPVL